jgi:hypothetical protein
MLVCLQIYLKRKKIKYQKKKKKKEKRAITMLELAAQFNPASFMLFPSTQR